ncbi:uncharacterized protein LOC106770093 [Vigna radiata var. radiata]|uniref:Uncharacterized protein LOC106770093 n=1 Tax=Vigna radiata var. radiata TaxID=3916 RepID=A0A1S3UZC6_VIGRR|nr:uncharacterized protein LOC106770093 [Vigna radiata var. radiata]
MERIYDAKRCGDENRLAFTEYLQTGEAGHWWNSTKMLLEDEHTPITWEIFKKKFYEEYFPNSVRFAKEVEFLQLVQVERAKVLKKNMMEAERRKKQQQPSCKGPVFSRTNLGSIKTPYSRPMPSSGPSGLVVWPINYARQIGQQGAVSYYICGGPHFKNECPQQGNSRFWVRCNKNGHWGEIAIWETERSQGHQMLEDSNREVADRRQRAECML